MRVTTPCVLIRSWASSTVTPVGSPDQGTRTKRAPVIRVEAASTDAASAPWMQSASWSAPRKMPSRSGGTRLKA